MSEVRLGILISRRWRPRQGSLFSRFAELGREMGMRVYWFAAHGIDWTAGTVTGWVLDQDGWHLRVLPLPAVVYNRLPTRRAERSGLIRRLRDRLHAAGIPMFNPGFFDKWTAWEHLSRDSELLPYLPETRLLVPDEFEPFSWVMYAKPVGGTLGRGVLRLTIQPDRSVLVQGRRPAMLTLPGVPDLRSWLKAYCGARTYVIQRGVQLGEVDGRPFDVRVLIQRDEELGQWQVTHRFVKVARAGAVVTNVAAGSRIDSFGRSYAGSRKLTDVRAELDAVAVRAAAAMARGMAEGRLLAEVGADLAVDERGQVWLLEVNAKYRRSVFPPAQRELSIRRVLAHARRLAGQA